MSAFNPWRRSTLRAILLALVILLPGTPYIVSAEHANESFLRLGALQAGQVASDDESPRSGAPPDEDELRSLSQTPSLSGANPPYPRNHVLDGVSQPLGTPPANHSFESSPTTTGTPPANHDLEAAPSSVGTPPTNNDFESGDLSGWATSGSVVIESDTPHGYYAKLSGGNATLISDAFTVDSATQVFRFDAGWLTTNNYSWVKVYVLSGTGYSTQTEVLSKNCFSCAAWEPVTVNASAWLGQTIKLKFWRYFGDIGIDAVEMVELLPAMTLTGGAGRLEEGGATFATLPLGATLTTSAFTVASDAQQGSVDLMGRTAFGDQYKVEVLSGASYQTATTVASGTVADSWTTVLYMLADWQGQAVKLRVTGQYATIGVDNLGLQAIELAEWELGGGAQIARVDAGGEHHARLAQGTLTSAPFTLDAAIQQVTLRYRAGSAASQFRVYLLSGSNYSQATNLDLDGIVGTSDQVNWQTFTAAVDGWAGESVKLKIEQHFGWGEYDLVGLGGSLLPGWTQGTLDAIAVGEDSGGSYVTGVSGGNGSGNFVLESSLISTGIIDSPAVEQRYYAVAYDIGYRTGALLRVSWHEEGTSQSWVVHQVASNTPTGYTVDYFWLADFMGADGHFTVELLDDGGKFYAIADNIARVQLSEPFSEQVGYNIDTSTGSFGYQETDIRTDGRLPLSFTRYYAGHSDHYGAMGFRWRHTYDIRLVVTADDDAGVIYGSGREVFFDEQNGNGLFLPADARVHDELVKNQDDTYTYTTSTNLIYDFDANGVLQTITDLNGNQITLSYNGSGQLTTITGLGNQIISLSYDGSGRLSTVTDPESDVWTYTYDVNVDLITVTAPDLGERDYQYSRHRLTKAINPLGNPLFENVFDDWHRVVQQKDADQNVLALDYDTPGAGATEVTDPENNTATYYFDQHQRTTDLVDPLGHTISRTYDGEGNLIRVIDPALYQWNFTYSTGGDLTSLEDPLGNDLQIVYNAEHLPTTITDARGNVTTYAYDANGNVTTRTNPLNNTWTFTYDVNGNALTETDPLNNTTTYTYDASGNVLTETDPLNNTWTYTYDNRGRMLTKTDPLNNTTTYTYNWAGWLVKETNALGHDVNYSYSLWGDLLERKDELGNTVSWTYDSNGWVTSRTDEAGFTTTYSYDANGNAIAITNALNETTSYTYDENNRVISITDPFNNTTTYAYDANGKLASETDPLGRTTSYGYDDSGRLTSRTLPNLGVWSYSYDANGNLTSITDPLSNVTSIAYDANNRRTSVTDPRNHTTSYGYDAAGRLTSITDPLNNTQTIVYDAAGRRISQTDALNNTWTTTYDAVGRSVTSTDPLNRTVTRSYDAVGQLTSFTDPLNNTTSYTYDAAGQRTQIARPSLSTVSYGYDPRGLLTSITDPLNNTRTFTYDATGQRVSMTDRRNNTTSYGFDAAGRITTMTDALSGVVTFGFDAAGQMTSVTNPNSNTWTYTYDDLGNRLTETNPLSQTSTFSYDLLGRLVSSTDPRNTTVSYSYDANSNLTGVTYPGGSISHSYDALNRRTSMLDSTGTTTWSYDANGQVTSVAAANGTVGYGYNAAGQRATMTLPGSRTLAYAYDGAGRTSSVTDWLSNTISFGYDVDGQRTSITRPNGVTSNYSYDAAGRVTLIDHSGINCQCTLQSFTSTYDAEGNRTSVTTAAGTESYTLDALNRLTQVVYPNNDTVDYTYDANGNRLTTTLNGNQIATYSYNAADQLLSDGSISYSYDAAGNLTTAGANTYTWDWASRLSSATVNGTTESYAYDGDGVRVSSTVGGVTTPYVWDRLGDVELLVDDGANAYINVDGFMAEIDSGNTVTYPLLDGLGSVRGLTDPNENLVGTADYSVFGSISSQTGATSIFGFTGEQHDAVTSQIYLRARYLVPDIGRFSAADTVQPNAPGTQGYNRYAYVANNPTTWIDPTGHNATTATTALRLSPFWFPIAIAIAEFFLAAACATGCIVVLVAIIIIALIVAA